MLEMSKSSVINYRSTSRAKIASGHALSSRITDPLQKVLLFSTPLLGSRGLNMPSRRTGNNDDVQLTCRTCSGRPLERSYSLNAKRRRNVAASCTHVCSNDFRKSSCLLPNENTFGDISRKVGRQWTSSTSKVLSRRSRLECLLLSESMQELDISVDSESVTTGSHSLHRFLLAFSCELYMLSAFLPAQRYASAGLCDSDVSVRLSVCPSHAGIVPSRAKAGS